MVILTKILNTTFHAKRNVCLYLLMHLAEMLAKNFYNIVTRLSV